MTFSIGKPKKGYRNLLWNIPICVSSYYQRSFFGKSRMKFQEWSAGHGIMNYPFVPQKRCKCCSQTLSHWRTHSFFHRPSGSKNNNEGNILESVCRSETTKLTSELLLVLAWRRRHRLLRSRRIAGRLNSGFSSGWSWFTTNTYSAWKNSKNTWHIHKHILYRIHDRIYIPILKCCGWFLRSTPTLSGEVWVPACAIDLELESVSAVKFVWNENGKITIIQVV